jgi:hypothetical protein
MPSPACRSCQPLVVSIKAAALIDGAGIEHLGLTLRWLSTLERDLAVFDQAADAFALCLTKRPHGDVPLDWASTQWNLADLALARYDITADATLLALASDHALAARAVFAEGSDHQRQRCDDLLTETADRA